MLVHSCNDPLMCLTFSSNLKGIAFDWFYSYNFEEELKRSSLSTPLTEKPRGTTTTYSLSKWDRATPQILHQLLQEQLAKVPNWGENVSALAFISGQQVSHPLCKYLLNHDAIKINEILSRVQPYSQLEEAMKNSPNHFSKRNVNGEKSELHYKVTTRYKNLNQGQSPIRIRRFWFFTESAQSLQADRALHFTQTFHQRSLQCH